MLYSGPLYLHNLHQIPNHHSQHFLFRRWYSISVSLVAGGDFHHLQPVFCTPNFPVNDIVFLKDSNIPQQQWPMGIVTQVFSSDDGLVRSVELKVPSATAPLRRPIQKLVLLVEAEQALDSH